MQNYAQNCANKLQYDVNLHAIIILYQNIIITYINILTQLT